MHTPHAVIVASSHMCRSEAGAAVPPRFITASHACTLPCIPSPYLSLHIPICNLFRVKPLFRSRCLSALRCLPSPSISLAHPLCNLACAHSLSFILSLCTGPRPSRSWCAALHACILPCLPSPYLSFPLPICNLFRISSHQQFDHTSVH